MNTPRSRRLLMVVVAGLALMGGQDHATVTEPKTTVVVTSVSTSVTIHSTTTSSTLSPSSPWRPAAGSTAYVSVAATTVWTSPRSPRSMDSPALKAPVDLRGWLKRMSMDDRRNLDGRAQTQVLFGEPLTVVSTSSDWVQVRVPGQPAPDKGGGYPGWVPLRQLSPIRAPAAQKVATVVRPTAWLRSPDANRGPVLEVSFGSRLPVVATSGDWVAVSGPSKQHFVIKSSEVAVAASAAPGLPRTGADLVRTARLFSGLQYLWAGTSGLGFDCSGFTYLVLRAHGVRIARDAAPQMQSGQAVARNALRPGDLLFFASRGVVHHVGMYVGNNTMINALQTGTPVTETRIDQQPWTSEYAGARRYV